MHTNKLSQSGRSMVEMLGTLAIIGVLSIGGIAGYNYGINKYRANTIINDIMLRATDAIAQFDTTGDANLSEWPTITAGKYTIGLEDETIGIQVDGLPKELCEMVYEGMKNHADIKFNATIYEQENDTLECGDTNTMVFYVEDTINIGQGEQLPDQTECSTNKECQTEDVCMGCIIPEGQETGVCEYACQELEYLESDGGQYIDTGVNGTNSTKIETEFEIKSDNNDGFVYGARTNASNKLFSLSINSNNGAIFCGFLNINHSATLPSGIPFYNYRMKTSHSINGFNINGINVINFLSSTDYITEHTILLFGLWSDGGIDSRLFKGKIYSFKIWENGISLRNFTPVLDPEGVPAMLDTVENKLYYNQGSGQFTYGK